MDIKKVNVLGMELERWVHKSCFGDFGVGGDYATLYSIQSAEEGKGHATELLKEAKAYYQAKGLRFGGSMALNPRMKSIYKKLGILEYT